MLISPQQIRTGSALRNLDKDERARRAQVSMVTIRRLETAVESAGFPVLFKGRDFSRTDLAAAL